VNYFCFSIVGFVALGLLSCREDDVKSEMHLPSYAVSVGYPHVGETQEFREWVGRLSSVQDAPILPQIEGYISERYFKNGQFVKKGELLYRIDDSVYKQDFLAAQQDVSAALATYKKAQQDADYYEPLVKSMAVSKRLYTDALAQADAAKASLAAATAVAKKAQINVAFCSLRAPMDGAAGFAQAYVGAYVSPNGKPLVLINRLDPIRVSFSVSEQDWIMQGGESGALHPGASLEMILPDDSIYPIKARLTGIDNEVDVSTGTLMIDAHVKNSAFLLRPGMYVKLRAALHLDKNQLLVPQSAIAQLQGENFVLAYFGKSKQGLDMIKMIPVELGLVKGHFVAVKGELSDSTLIITKGTQQGMMAAAHRAVLVPHQQDRRSSSDAKGGVAKGGDAKTQETQRSKA